MKIPKPANRTIKPNTVKYQMYSLALEQQGYWNFVAL